MGEPKKRRTWDQDKMIEAIKALRQKKMGLKKAVKEFSVPKSTLRRFVHSDLAPEVAVENCLSKKSITKKKKQEVVAVTITPDFMEEDDSE